MTDPFNLPDDGTMEVIDAGEPLNLGGQTMQRMGGGYATAISVQRPRELSDIKRRLVEEAALGGESFFYGWGKGDDRIEGPSIELAQSAARCWGNCAIEIAPVQETDNAWIFTSYFIDLETGFTLARQFRQSKKWTVYGRMDAERKDDVRFQIGQSKAIRNVILNALPASLIKQAMLKAKAGVREQIEKYIKDKGIVSAIEMILRALKKHGVKEEMILKKFDYASRDALNVDDIVILRGDLHAIDNGQETADALYPSSAANGDAPTGKQEFGFGNKAEQRSDPTSSESKPSNDGSSESLKGTSTQASSESEAATPLAESTTSADEPENPTPTESDESTPSDGQGSSAKDTGGEPAEDDDEPVDVRFDELRTLIRAKAKVNNRATKILATAWLKKRKKTIDNLADDGVWQIVYKAAERVDWEKFKADNPKLLGD